MCLIYSTYFQYTSFGEKMLTAGHGLVVLRLIMCFLITAYLALNPLPCPCLSIGKLADHKVRASHSRNGMPLHNLPSTLSRVGIGYTSVIILFTSTRQILDQCALSSLPVIMDFTRLQPCTAPRYRCNKMVAIRIHITR